MSFYNGGFRFIGYHLDISDSDSDYQSGENVLSYRFPVSIPIM